jgi:hypothetical protein
MQKKSPTMVRAGHKAAKVRQLNERLTAAEAEYENLKWVIAGLKAAKTRVQNGN